MKVAILYLQKNATKKVKILILFMNSWLRGYNLNLRPSGYEPDIFAPFLAVYISLQYSLITLLITFFSNKLTYHFMSIII